LPGAAMTPLDQTLGVGDGVRATFKLTKTYGGAFAPYVRAITKPVEGSVRVTVGGVEKTLGVHFGVDTTTGLVTFAPGAVPAVAASVTAGYAFDVPVRFDTDFLEIDMEAFEAGVIPKIPIIEVIP
jgi:uncharacterized protein (TIGR02217 family)